MMMYHPSLKSLHPEQDPVGTLKKLRTIKLFQPLDDASLLSIATKLYESHFDKETAIFYESDLPSETGRKVYFVLEGCVKLVKYSSDGESTIVRLASKGEFFGVTGAITNQPLPFSALAFTDTNLLTLDIENFRKVVFEHPNLALDMVVALGEVLWFNYETHNQVVKRTDARVSKIILYHLLRDGHEDTPQGQQLKILLPHNYIASMTGIAYEESVRIVSRLRKQYSCIQYLRGGKIVITNLKQLKELAQGDDLWGV
jgi:CRP-like cAMP-binding protein